MAAVDTEQVVETKEEEELKEGVIIGIAPLIEKYGYLFKDVKFTFGTGDFNDFWDVVAKDESTVKDIREKLDEVTHEIDIKIVFAGVGNTRMAREIIGDWGYTSEEKGGQ